MRRFPVVIRLACIQRGINISRLTYRFEKYSEDCGHGEGLCPLNHLRRGGWRPLSCSQYQKWLLPTCRSLWRDEVNVWPRTRLDNPGWHTILKPLQGEEWGIGKNEGVLVHHLSMVSPLGSAQRMMDINMAGAQERHMHGNCTGLKTG